jgi:hypothetical protein
MGLAIDKTRGYLTRVMETAAPANYTPGTKIPCPCCTKAVKITAKGEIARHGYKTAGGLYNYGATCTATGATNAREALTAMHAKLVKALERTEAAIVDGSARLGRLHPSARPDALQRQIASVESRLSRS